MLLLSGNSFSKRSGRTYDYNGNTSDSPVLKVSYSEGSGSVAVTGVSITGCPSASMTVGETATISVAVQPAEATEKSVSWASSNTSVTTVSASGQINSIAPGEAVITVTTTDGSFQSQCTITVASGNSGDVLAQTYGNEGTPGSGSPWIISASGTTIIEAENYNQGGQGTGYNDSDGSNSGGQYRTEGVDIQTAEEGGYNIGYINQGEWLDYTIDVEKADTYDLELRIARQPSGSSSAKVLFGSSPAALEDKTGTVSIPSTTGWQIWETVQISDVTLNAGKQLMRLSFTGGLYNINYLSLTPASGSGDTEDPDIYLDALDSQYHQ